MCGSFDFPPHATVGLHLMRLMAFIMMHDIYKKVSRLCAAVLPALCFVLLSSQVPLLAPPLLLFLQLPFLSLTFGVSPSLAPNHSLAAMLFLFFAFGILISLMSLVTAFNAAGCSPRAGNAPHACHGRTHGKRLSNYSSVDHYRGSDFLDDS